MGPEIWLPLRNKVLKLPKFPIEVGIEPERLLVDKSRYISLERFPNWEGMVP